MLDVGCCPAPIRPGFKVGAAESASGFAGSLRPCTPKATSLVPANSLSRFSMNIHEYQARELFGKYGVATQPGRVAGTPEEAEKVATDLGTKELIVKAQIHAGGRGKGTFKSGFKGGVHVCS